MADSGKTARGATNAKVSPTHAIARWAATMAVIRFSSPIESQVRLRECTETMRWLRSLCCPA